MTVSEKLQDILNDEYQAHLLYGAYGATLLNNGITGLGKKYKAESKEEYGHAKDIEDRLLILGEPIDVQVSKMKAVDNPLSIVKQTEKLETAAVQKYKELYQIALDENDPVTADLAKDHAHDEEGHLNWVQEQLYIISKIGEALWLQGWIHGKG